MFFCCCKIWIPIDVNIFRFSRKAADCLIWADSVAEVHTRSLHAWRLYKRGTTNTETDFPTIQWVFSFFRRVCVAISNVRHIVMVLHNSETIFTVYRNSMKKYQQCHQTAISLELPRLCSIKVGTQLSYLQLQSVYYTRFEYSMKYKKWNI